MDEPAGLKRGPVTVKSVRGPDVLEKSLKCPRCHTRSQAAARFCGRCGQPLVDGAVAATSGEASPTAGTRPARHPDPLTPPEGFRECGEMPDLYYRWEAAWGGTMLLGTETLAVKLFNGGYPLEDVSLRICGLGVAGKEMFALDQTLEDLPRGREVTIEVPSYELPAPVSDLTVSLVSGKYAATT